MIKNNFYIFLIVLFAHIFILYFTSYFLEINSKAKIIVSTEVKNGTYYSKRTGLRKISIEFDFDKYADCYHIGIENIEKNSGAIINPTNNPKITAKTISFLIQSVG